MDQERNQVLEMLRAGRISAEEAQTLLAALEASMTGEPARPAAPIDSRPPEPSPPPDFDRFRHFWRFPFAAVAVVAVVLGVLLVGMTQNAAGRLTLALLCAWPFFLGAVGLALVLLWSRWATWVHVRVQEGSGRRVAISLPVPLRLAGSLLPVVRSLVPASVRPQLDLAIDVLSEMRRLSPGEPLFLDVDDEDGERVQVYVG